MSIIFLLLYPVGYLVLGQPFDSSFWVGLVILIMLAIPVFMDNLERKKD